MAIVPHDQKELSNPFFPLPTTYFCTQTHTLPGECIIHLYNSSDLCCRHPKVLTVVYSSLLVISIKQQALKEQFLSLNTHICTCNRLDALILSLSVKCLKCAVWLLLQHCLWVGTRAHSHRGAQIKIPKHRETNGWLPLMNRDRDWRDRGNVQQIVLQLYKKQKFTDASLIFNAHNLSCFYVTLVWLFSTQQEDITHLHNGLLLEKSLPIEQEILFNNLMSTQSELIMLHKEKFPHPTGNLLSLSYWWFWQVGLKCVQQLSWVSAQLQLFGELALMHLTDWNHSLQYLEIDILLGMK